MSKINQKMVTVKVVSAAGHDEPTMTATEAVAYIKDRCKNEAKWAYLDGTFMADLNDITANAVAEAEDIVLTNQLVGGDQ